MRGGTQGAGNARRRPPPAHTHEHGHGAQPPAASPFMALSSPLTSTQAGGMMTSEGVHALPHRPGTPLLASLPQPKTSSSSCSSPALV